MSHLLSELRRAHALVTTRCVVNCVYFLIDSKMIIKKIWTAVEIFKWPRGSPFEYHRKQQPVLQMLGAAFRELSQNFFLTLGCAYVVGTAGSETHETLLNTSCAKNCQYPLFKNIFHGLPLGLTAAFNLNYCIVRSLNNKKKKKE